MTYVFSSVSDATTWILHENGCVSKFEHGIPDLQTLDMQNTDLEVFQDGKPSWYADGLTVENIFIVEGRAMILERIKIDGYV